MSYQPPQGYPPQGPQWPEQGPGYPPPQGPGQGYPGAPQGPGYPGAPQGYYQQMPGAYGMPQPDSRGGVAIAGLVLGIISIPAAVLPICGFPFAIAGLICGILGRASLQRKTLATVGLVLAIVGFVLSIASAAYGVYAVTHGGVSTTP